MNPFDVVRQFEDALSDYTEAPYVVAVDSCTNALFLSLLYWRTGPSDRFGRKVVANIPKRTYVGVPMAAKNAGYVIEWRDEDWRGAYHIGGTPVVDAAKRLRRGMYEPNTLMCMSFQAYKHLPIGRGGAILTDSASAAQKLRKMRLDGRTERARLQEPDSFDTLGYHMYMTPPDAARGMWLLSAAKDVYEDQTDKYQDLSKIKLFND